MDRLPANVVPGRRLRGRTDPSNVIRALRRAASLTVKRIEASAVDPRRFTTARVVATSLSFGGAGGVVGGTTSGGGTGATTGGVTTGKTSTGATSAGGPVPSAGGDGGDGGGGGGATSPVIVTGCTAAALPAVAAVTVGEPL